MEKALLLSPTRSTSLGEGNHSISCLPTLVDVTRRTDPLNNHQIIWQIYKFNCVICCLSKSKGIYRLDVYSSSKKKCFSMHTDLSFWLQNVTIIIYSNHHQRTSESVCGQSLRCHIMQGSILFHIQHIKQVNRM